MTIVLLRLTSAVAVGTFLVLILYPWLSGPPSVALSLVGGTAASSLVDDRLSRRRFEWGRALAQGIVCGAVVWGVLRWLGAR